MQNEPSILSILSSSAFRTGPDQFTPTTVDRCREYVQSREERRRKNEKNTSTASSFLRRASPCHVPLAPSGLVRCQPPMKRRKNQKKKEGQPQGKRSLLLSLFPFLSLWFPQCGRLLVLPPPSPDRPFSSRLVCCRFTTPHPQNDLP